MNKICCFILNSHSSIFSKSQVIFNKIKTPVDGTNINSLCMNWPLLKQRRDMNMKRPPYAVVPLQRTRAKSIAKSIGVLTIFLRTQRSLDIA